jgi:hypothetical protein
MRILVIDPIAEIIEERDIKGGRLQIEKIVGAYPVFGGWFGRDAVYVAEWPDEEGCFRLGDAGWISGRAVVAGAAAGPAGWYAPATMAIDELVAQIAWFEKEAPRPTIWLNNRWCRHLSEREAFEAILFRRAERSRRSLCL